MSEVKKIARVEIEFDAQGLEDGRIEFELEGKRWEGFPVGSIHPDIRKRAEEIMTLRQEYGFTFEEACRVRGI